jgi:hypothetical protein
MNHPTFILKRSLAAALLLFLGTSCSFSAGLPLTQVKTGPTQTADLSVPLPADISAPAELNIEFIAGTLTVSPGAKGVLASGSALYNAPSFAPNLEASETGHTLRTGTAGLDGFPIVRGEFTNEWDLRLAAVPLTLSLNAGAYTGVFELGGLAIHSLTINDGGSDFSGAFSTPNQAAMTSFIYNTGASDTRWSGLANANFAEMVFSCGAGDHTLGFQGALQRDARVQIDSGLGTLTLIVPSGTPAQVHYEGGLSTVNMEGSWSQDGSLYSLPGSGPSLDITVKLGAGTLNLKNE